MQATHHTHVCCTRKLFDWNMSTVQESIVCVTDSRYKSNIDNLIKMVLPILDAEGYAICLDLQITYRQQQQQKSKFLRNWDGRSTKGFHANSQTHWMGVYVGKSSTVHWMGYLSANKTQWVSTAYYECWWIFWLTFHVQYHLQCVELELEPRNWVCIACEASGQGSGGKRQRRWGHITIYRSVPDWVS